VRCPALHAPAHAASVNLEVRKPDEALREPRLGKLLKPVQAERGRGEQRKRAHAADLRCDFRAFLHPADARAEVRVDPFS
jgi:hypothetical protein